MAKYWVAIHHPDDFDAMAVEDPEMDRAIDELNDAMVDAGVRTFVGGLQEYTLAKSVIADGNGHVTVTDGPYMKGAEHVAGFWVLDVSSHEKALEWGRKATIACRAPVEGRPFH